eukprot:scaffold9328_cov17-Prasinocladus_malaysianus.AAC.1
MQPVRVVVVRVFVFVPVDAWQETGHTTVQANDWRVATTGTRSTASCSARPLVRLQGKRQRALLYGSAKSGNATNKVRTNAFISVRLGMPAPVVSCGFGRLDT